MIFHLFVYVSGLDPDTLLQASRTPQDRRHPLPGTLPLPLALLLILPYAPRPSSPAGTPPGHPSGLDPDPLPKASAIPARPLEPRPPPAPHARATFRERAVIISGHLFRAGFWLVRDGVTVDPAGLRDRCTGPQRCAVDASTGRNGRATAEAMTMAYATFKGPQLCAWVV